MFIPKIKSIKNKIVAGIMLVCVLTLTTGFSIVLIEDIAKIKRSMADQAAMAARVIGESCVSAISFNYPEKAEKNLSLIGSLPGFENARIFNEKGELFAGYDKYEKNKPPPLKSLAPSREYVGNYLHLVEPMVYEGKTYGVIYLRVRPSMKRAIRSRLVIMGSVMLGLLFLSWLLAGLVQKIISTPILHLARTAEKISEETDYSLQIENTHTGEIAILFEAFKSMLSAIQQRELQMERENWLKSGQGAIHDRMRGEQEVKQLSENILMGLKGHIDFQVGAVYVANGQKNLFLAGGYALCQPRRIREKWLFGEGLAGQAAVEQKRILVSNLPEGYVWVTSGVGEASPRFLLAMPFIYEGRVKGVLELGSFNEFGERELELLDHLAMTIAIAIHTAQAREQVHELLEQTQAQTEELQVQTEELQSQQEELRKVNQELGYQTEVLRKSEKRLQQQQEELQQTNEELEEQRDDINKKNEELEKARNLVEKKASDLEITSRYKSEFLANMSHELRTPLNSILLLSDVLMENREGILSEKHVMFSQNIHDSGTELLELINEILDLAKVESGKMELVVEDLPLDDLMANMERTFAPVARKKGLSLIMEIRKGDDLPRMIRTDRQKIEQVLKNLLSNAFKFTGKGRIILSIQRPGALLKKQFPSLDPDTTMVFSVADTGIGIPEDKQLVIFDAFMQVDGTTSRKYGGTGLGLSISRQIAGMLGGELSVSSRPGEGATFSLILPQVLPGSSERIELSEFFEPPEYPNSQEKNSPTGNQPAPAGEIPPELQPRHTKNEQKPVIQQLVKDDRRRLDEGERLLLIIEDDPKFSSILRDLAHENGFQTLIAADGKTGLYFVDYYSPSAVILDIGLPDMDGWAVMSRIKNNLATRHIPVHIISASEKKRKAMKMGAVDFLTKPVSLEKLELVFNKLGNFLARPVKNLMVVEDDEVQLGAIRELIGNGDVRVTGVSTGRAAKERLLSEAYDCLILDLNLPDMSGEELLTAIKNEASLHEIPVIIYTAKDLTNREKATLQADAESIIIKGMNSSERLLDETALFLHRVEASLSRSKREILHRIHDQGSILKDKQILMVDDDMRNVFAIGSILEDQGLAFTVSKNGREALETLEKNPSIHLVLMDMMMPEMDGYQAMTEIRKQKRFEKLPIIAITAKAMKGDRFKCIEAGASDYLAKPIDRDKLLSMMRVWLY